MSTVTFRRGSVMWLVWVYRVERIRANLLRVRETSPLLWFGFDFQSLTLYSLAFQRILLKIWFYGSYILIINLVFCTFVKTLHKVTNVWEKTFKLRLHFKRSVVDQVRSIHPCNFGADSKRYVNHIQIITVYHILVLSSITQ